MILIVGGLGFVGSNTAEALAEMGYEPVLTQHRTSVVPAFLEQQLGRKIFVEPADASQAETLVRIGEKYKIDGIIHLAGSFTPGALSPITDLRGNFDQLMNIFSVAEKWKVRRLTVASTVGVYGGSGNSPLQEDRMLPVSGSFSIPAHKKIMEIASSDFEKGSGVETICVRLPGMFGPWANPRQRILATRLVHAAVKHESPVLDGVFGGPSVEDGLDICYIKDVARAITLLQTARDLRHRVYNVGLGRATPNGELLESVRQAVPEFDFELPPGRSSGAQEAQFMDIERLRTDTGYSTSYGIRAAVSDYVDWLRAGNAR